MNDEDYLTVLREELNEITAELQEARAYREKRKKLIEALQEERASLLLQKEERTKRSEVLLRVEALEEKYRLKKKERNSAFTELSVAVKSCNRLLIATGRPPMEEPIEGKALPRDELLKRKKKREEQGTLSKSLTALPLVAPSSMSQHTRITEASLPSFNTKLDILADNNSVHSATSSKSGISKGSKLVVNGILKKRDTTPRGGNPKKPVAKLRRRPQNGSGKKKETPKVKARIASETNQPKSEAPKKSARVDGDGDMTNFLDSIGYYSPEEGEA